MNTPAANRASRVRWMDAVGSGLPLARAMLVGLALGGASLLPCGLASAASTVQLVAEVPAGKTKAVRLRRLPRSAVVAVRVRANASLRVALVSAAQLKARKPQALFRGALERSLAFQVVVPESGDYYLVLDNRRGKVPVKTQTTISAKKPRTEQPPPARSPRKIPREDRLDETRAPVPAHAQRLSARPEPGSRPAG